MSPYEKKNLMLQIDNRNIPLDASTQLFRYHLDERSSDSAHPFARVRQHPENMDILGLQNLSGIDWIAIRPDGSRTTVSPAKSISLIPGLKIQFGEKTGIVSFTQIRVNSGMTQLPASEDKQYQTSSGKVSSISRKTETPSATFRANPQRTGEYDNGGIEPVNNELWRFKTGEAVLSSPAVVNGVVYVGSWDNNLYAIDALTGKEKWRFNTGKPVDSSPAVSNGVVYIGSWDNNLYAVDEVNGHEKWHFETKGHVSSSPVTVDGVVYFGNDDHKLYAVDAVTGKEKWWFQTNGYVRSSPAVADGIIYIGGWGNALIAIDLQTGRELWRYETFRGRSMGAPVLSGGIVYIAAPDGMNLALKSKTGEEIWRIQAKVDFGISAISNNILFGGGYRTYAFDANNGKEIWRSKITGFRGFPTVSHGSVYQWNDEGALYAMDAMTGIEKWHYTMSGKKVSSPVVADGTVYIGSDDHHLYAIGANHSQDGSRT